MNQADSLTARELEILGLIAAGLTNREIAVRLHLSYKTVKWYNTQIYSKLGVSNRDEAIEQAQALDLLDADEPAAAFRHNLTHQTTRHTVRAEFERSLELGSKSACETSAPTPSLNPLGRGMSTRRR